MRFFVCGFLFDWWRVLLVLGNMWEAACEGENRTEGSACGARRRPEDVFYYDGLVRRGVRGKVA